jgi:Ca2+-transporting ATPase
LICEDEETRAVGDPLDAALAIAAHEENSLGDMSDRSLALAIPFDAERKRMTNVYIEGGHARAFSKGAPETVIERCRLDASERERLDRLTSRWAGDGLRVLAVATRDLPRELADSDDAGAIEADLDLVGLVALHDPLRPGARDAISQARSAGLGVELLTGDHHATARAIAAELGLEHDAVAARVTPKDKLQLVERLQAQDEVVAVTGDGVNDAPALRRADVGVSMGRSGTEAAREASDVVLTDDDFATIVGAIAEGRAITANVRKFVAFLLSANLGEVLLFGVAVTSGLGAPMAVTQVLLVNVLTDGLPAIALARDPAASDIMQRPPERQRRLFGRAGLLSLALVGLLVGAAALAALLVGRADSDAAGRTMAFATIALAELAVVFAVRSPIDSAWRIGRNLYLVTAVLLSLALVLLAVYWEPVQEPLGTVSLDGSQLLVVAALSLMPLIVVELTKGLLRRFALSRAELALLPSTRRRPPLS